MQKSPQRWVFAFENLFPTFIFLYLRPIFPVVNILLQALRKYPILALNLKTILLYHRNLFCFNTLNPYKIPHGQAVQKIGYLFLSALKLKLHASVPGVLHPACQLQQPRQMLCPVSEPHPLYHTGQYKMLSNLHLLRPISPDFFPLPSGFLL